MKTIHSTVMMLAIMVATLGFTACGGDGDNDEVDNGGGNVSIVGMWECTSFINNDPSIEGEIQIGDRICFKPDGTYYWDDGYDGQWSLEKEHLKLDGLNCKITKLTSTELAFEFVSWKIHFRFKRLLDEKSLEGSWAGNMYISSSWKGRSYDSYETVLTFLDDPMISASGSGYWVDYYMNAPWRYVANHINWKVDNDVIQIYLVEEETTMVIRDYCLYYDHFAGKIDDPIRGYYGVQEFDLCKTKTPDYSNYSWGYIYSR